MLLVKSFLESVLQKWKPVCRCFFHLTQYRKVPKAHEKTRPGHVWTAEWSKKLYENHNPIFVIYFEMSGWDLNSLIENWEQLCSHSQRSEKDHFVLDDAPVLTYSYLLGRKFLSIICSVFVSVNSDNSLAQVTVLLWWMFDYLLYANNWRNTNVFWRNNQNG